MSRARCSRDFPEPLARRLESRFKNERGNEYENKYGLAVHAEQLCCRTIALFCRRDEFHLGFELAGQADHADH